MPARGRSVVAASASPNISRESSSSSPPDHPRRGEPEAPPALQPPESIEKLEKELLLLIPDAKQTLGKDLLAQIRDARARDVPEAPPSPPLSHSSVQEIVRETLAQLDEPRPRTYAEALARTLPAPVPKPVPARHAHELLIATRNCSEQIRTMSPASVVTAVNMALHADAVAASRRLPSGDTVLTFHSDCSTYTADSRWVNAAFGPAASLSRRIYSMVVKGVPLEDVPQDTSDLNHTLATQNKVTIAMAKVRRPRGEAATKATLIIGTHDTDTANKLCARGVFLNAQVFRCEPYAESVRPLQCFQCHQFGHLARFCQEKARCGRCACSEHPHGAPCPANSDPSKTRCVNCKGPHPAWARECPVVTKNRTRAQEAYAHRPTLFQTHQASSITPSPAKKPGTAPRPVGRPPGSTNILGKRVLRSQKNTISFSASQPNPTTDRPRPSTGATLSLTQPNEDPNVERS